MTEHRDARGSVLPGEKPPLPPLIDAPFYEWKVLHRDGRSQTDAMRIVGGAVYRMAVFSAGAAAGAAALIYVPYSEMAADDGAAGVVPRPG